jgi:hypothetical protein
MKSTAERPGYGGVGAGRDSVWPTFIGYNRAARIMDLMEERGVVGPENGSSPREILVDLDR